MQQTASLSPQLFFETISAFQRSAAIKSAVELDVFTKIAEGKMMAREIGEACNAAERGVRILCDALVVMGFLFKEDEKYNLTEESATFLNRNSPVFVGNAVDFILSPQQRRGFDDLTAVVKQGGSTVTEEGSLDPESPMWVKFARGMMPMMMPAAQMMAGKLEFEPNRKLKVLDIAAGHGIFGIAVAQNFPNAEIFAVDWANVLQVAKENAQKFGVADRYYTIEGSAFDVKYGNDYDVVLLTNFLHHFDKSTDETLLKKIYAALSDNGKVLTLEFVPNDDRISPRTKQCSVL